MIAVWGVSFAVSLMDFTADLIILGQRLNRSHNISQASLVQNKTQHYQNCHKTVITPKEIKSRFFRLFQRKGMLKIN